VIRQSHGVKIRDYACIAELHGRHLPDSDSGKLPGYAPLTLQNAFVSKLKQTILTVYIDQVSTGCPAYRVLVAGLSRWGK
jgi:hypothetical protein